MITSTDLFARLDDYLKRRITLEELEEWVTPRLKFFLLTPDSASGKLAGAIELCLAEMHASLRSERNVRVLLSRYKTELHQVMYREYPDNLSQTATTSTTSGFIEGSWWLNQQQVWNTAPGEVSV